MQTSERIYEAPVWLSLDDEGSVAEARIGRIREELVRLGAQILHETKPIKRRLAYPVKKFSEGAFVVFDILMDPQLVRGVAARFKHDRDVIRIGIVEKAKPQPETTMRRDRIRAVAPAESEATGEERPAAKMEDLEKKLEEILRGN